MVSKKHIDCYILFGCTQEKEIQIFKALWIPSLARDHDPQRTIGGELPTRFFVNLDRLFLSNRLKLATCPTQYKIRKYYLILKK